MSTPIVRTAKEAIAVQLHHQGRSMAQIQTNTGLDREDILAAIDRDATARQQNPTTPPPTARKDTLSKPVKRAKAPANRTEKINRLRKVIEAVRKHLTEYEAELAELLGADAPAPGVDLAALADSPEVRDWAIAEGWHVPAVGRLPGGIVAAYINTKGAGS